MVEGRAQYGGVSGPFDWYVGGFGQSQGNFQIGGGAYEQNTSFTRASGTVALGYAFDENNRVDVTLRTDGIYGAGFRGSSANVFAYDQRFNRSVDATFNGRSPDGRMGLMFQAYYVTDVDDLNNPSPLSTLNALAARTNFDDNRRQLAALRKQLLHAGRMAAVGTLFAGLTHELNNPLSVIVGNVDNLRNLAPAGEPIARVIDAIDRQATRATRLVSALLRFSRTGPGAAEEVPPDELVRLVVDLLAAEARRREIALRVSVADGLNPLVVVRHEVESALVNITTNALQATPEGGVVELLVFAESRDVVPGVRFVARDTGIGIAPEILPQIFDPFFTTKPEGEGTGLGLSLAREIAISHGGQLTVESVVGHGTTMSLWLPERVSSARSRRSPTG